jgi:hypothetical protein
LEELMAANPTVQPNFLSIGTLLVIPPSSQPAPGVTATGDPPTPTPVPMERGALACSRTKEGGAWCFLPVHNAQPYPLEGVTALFRLAGADADAVLEQRATLPLDRLASGARLPLAVYFPSPVPEPFQASVELQSALPSPEDGRYLAVRLDNKRVLLAESGLSAAVEVEIALDAPGAAALRVWVAAVAYDEQGGVVGLRRWEHPGEPPLESGQALPVRFEVYSVSRSIERVELYGEARP